VPSVSKQQIIEPLKNAGQARIGLNVGITVHALAAHEFVPVVALAVVHVEPATRCHGCRVNDEFADPHDAIRVVVHFDHEYGGDFGYVGRRPVNAARVVVPAAPIHVFAPRFIVKSRAHHLVHFGSVRQLIAFVLLCFCAFVLLLPVLSFYLSYRSVVSSILF